jgi:riboflavin synthase alpha subunit
MFTGIIEKIGKVSHVTEKNISQVISIRIDDFNSALGDSICINGVSG